jgi:hypothetical protein
MRLLNRQARALRRAIHTLDRKGLTPT